MGYISIIIIDSIANVKKKEFNTTYKTFFYFLYMILKTLLCKNIFQSEYGVFQCTRGSNRLNQRLNVEMYFIECVLELVNGRANQLAVKHASLHMI